MTTFEDNDFAQLFSALLGSLGLPAETPEHGQASLRIGERLIHLDWSETRGSILLWAYVSDLARSEPSAEDLRRALETGFLLAFEHGAGLSYNRASRAFMLAQPIGPAGMTPKALETHLAEFTAAYDLAHAHLARGAASPAAEEPPVDSDSAELMIRI